MKKISFIVTGSGTINAVANNKAYTVPRDHPNYKEIKAAVLKDDSAVLDSLVNVQKAIEKQGEGNTEVRDGVVYYKGTEVHNVLAERILGLMRDEFPVAPMLRFLDNLMENPSFRAVNELYAFLEHKCLPLTEDGCFLGYKRVRDNYTDQHSGKYDNSVGKVHEIPRNTVDDNWRLECSNGFHVGSIEYVRNFHGGTGHVMIVKVNPRDVVAVPPNECTKMRVCRYEVMNEYDKNLIDALPASLYTAEATPANRVPESGGMGGYGYRDDEDEDDFDDDEDGDLDDDDDDDFDDEDEDDEYPTKG